MNFSNTGTPTNSVSLAFVSLYRQDGYPCTNSLVFYTLLKQPIMNRILDSNNPSILSPSAETLVTELSKEESKYDHGFKPIFSSPTLISNDEFYLTFHPKKILKSSNAQELNKLPPCTSIELENEFLKLYDPNYIEVMSCTRSVADITEKNTNESIISYQEQHIEPLSSGISLKYDCGCSSGNSIQEPKSRQDIVIKISGLKNQKGKDTKCSCDLEPNLLLRENCKSLNRNSRNNLVFDTLVFSNNCNSKCVSKYTGNSGGLDLSTTNDKSTCKVMNKYEDGGIYQCARLSRDDCFDKETIEYYDKIFNGKWDVQQHKGPKTRTNSKYPDTLHNKSKATVECIGELVLQQKNSCTQVTFNKKKSPKCNGLEDTVKQSNHAPEKLCCLESKPIETSRNRVVELASQPDAISKNIKFSQNAHYFRSQAPKKSIKFSESQGQCSKCCQCDFRCSEVLINLTEDVQNKESQWDETIFQKPFKSELEQDKFNIKQTRSAQTIRNTKDSNTNTDESHINNNYDLSSISTPRYPETYDLHQYLLNILVSMQNNKKTVAFLKTQTKVPYTISRKTNELNVDHHNTNLSITAQNLMNNILKSAMQVPNTDTFKYLCRRRMTMPISQSYCLSKSVPSLNCTNFRNSLHLQNSKSQKYLSDHSLLLPKNKCYNCNLLFHFGNNARSRICYKCDSKNVRFLINTTDNKVNNAVFSYDKSLELCEGRELRNPEISSIRLAASCKHKLQTSNSMFLINTNDNKVNNPVFSYDKSLELCEGREFRNPEISSIRLAASCKHKLQTSNSMLTNKRFIRILKNKFMMLDTFIHKIRSKFMKTKSNNIFNQTQNGAKYYEFEKKRKSSYVNLQKNYFLDQIGIVENRYELNIFDMDKKFNDIKDISITGQLGPSWDDVKKQAKEMRHKNWNPKKQLFSCFRKPGSTPCESSTPRKYNTLAQNSTKASGRYLPATKYKPDLKKEKNKKLLQNKDIDPITSPTSINNQNQAGTLVKGKCVKTPSDTYKNKANSILNTGVKATDGVSSVQKHNAYFAKKRKVKFAINKDSSNELHQVENKNALLDPRKKGVIQVETINSAPENGSDISACVGLPQCQKKHRQKDHASIDRNKNVDLEKYNDQDQTSMFASENPIACHDNTTFKRTIPKKMKCTNSTGVKSVSSVIFQPPKSKVNTEKSIELSDYTRQKHSQVSQLFENAKKKLEIIENSNNRHNNRSIVPNSESRQIDQYSSTDNITDPNIRKAKSVLHSYEADNTMDTFLAQLVLGSNINFYSESSAPEFLLEIKNRLSNELSSCFQQGDDKQTEKLSHFIKFINGKLGLDLQYDSSTSDSLMNDLSQERVIRRIVYSGSS